ncbi:galactokinase [Actinomadura opuntiae]|uniref:galactokinase n=1 Tax=Actinomadura sp. OS1-43 TaxID=604315 RepID=UPI00255AF30B|nr:galactokinase [Actinomadura sp. OS1-43]MDL4818464.1 galactokinase [Actinomadura sp. OS1-43]
MTGPITAEFAGCYGRPPVGVWHAPGRVNLIGEHTDYNDGLALPFALGQGVRVAAAPREGVLELRSRQVPDAPFVVDLSEIGVRAVTGWAAYGAGIWQAFHKAGHPVGGAAMLVDSDLPQGAGLASSAALECAIALALRDLYGLPLTRTELVRIAQQAENEFVGVPCGVLDQSAAMLCTAGNALLLDCRTWTAVHIPVALNGLTLLVIDTRAQHELLDGAYASRRSECERAARLLGVRTLRDLPDPAKAAERLAERGLRRLVRHVVTENERVGIAVDLLAADRGAEVGALLNASHRSLRDDFEVSWPEADAAVDAAVRAGAAGARMLGGGFGGSVLALVEDRRLPGVRAAVEADFARRGWAAPAFLAADPSAGAHRVTGLRERVA